MTLIVIVVMPVFASPAHACSCAQPPDIGVWLDDSEAAFVGKLVEKRDVADFESIYVFEVEEWVKGDAGDVIEVRSASDGAGCGFEFWDPDQRIGAIIYEESGELHGGLCDQIDPDVLLAVVRGPTPSSTGVGHLLVAQGWSSNRLTVLDDVGGHVTELIPGDSVLPQIDGTQHLVLCPDGGLMLQHTNFEIVVWDLETLTVVASHEIPLLDASFVSDVSCRSADASSIWVVAGTDIDSRLVEVLPEPITLTDLPGTSGHIGSNFVVSQEDAEGDVTWVDPSSGEQTTLTETPSDQLVSMSVATHPNDPKIALVETTFQENGPVTATLSVVDDSGTRLQTFEIPWETYSPTWLDETRVAVKAYNFENWEESFGFVFDVETGEMTELPGWDAEFTIADGNVVYGVRGSSIVTADLTNGEIETMVTLPSQGAGPLVLLQNPSEVAPTTTVEPAQPETPPPTTPPLVVSGLDEDVGTGSVRWIGGGAIVVFFVVLIWLALRSPKRTP